MCPFGFYLNQFSPEWQIDLMKVHLKLDVVSAKIISERNLITEKILFAVKGAPK